MSEWQPIETAPIHVPMLVFGWRWQGQAAPGGPYKWYITTIGELQADGTATDFSNAGCDCVAPEDIPNPTHWMPLPKPPGEA